MPSSQPIIALNLGMQNLTAARFQPLPTGGLHLQDWREYELTVDPAADVTRLAHITTGTREVLDKLGCKGKTRIHVCLPSQAVFTRFLRLPGSSAEDVRSIINFEAQQNVPFPIEEVVWDYQVLGQARENNWDVVLVAIKNEQLNEIYNALTQAGAIPAILDVAPLALANAFRFNYHDFSGCTLLVDMGARTTNLVFIEGEKVFSRTIPIGGNTITTSYAKELGCSVDQAETLKREQAYVALGGAYADNPDPNIAKMSKLARATMTRLHSEISRSISYYRANQGGSQPSRAFLCGGSMKMDYMWEFFAEKLPMPVEYFNPFRNISADSGILPAIEARLFTLGELAGCALRATGNCPVEINLKPAAAKLEEETSRRILPFGLSIGAAAAGLLAAAAYFHASTTGIAEVNAGLQKDITRLENLSKQLAAATTERQKFQELAAPLLAVAEERVVWLRLLDSLGQALPPRFIWVTRLIPLIGEEEALPDKLPSRPTPAQPQSQNQGRGQPQPPRPPRPGAPPEPQAPPPAITALKVEGFYLENPEMVAVVDRYVDNLAKNPLFRVDDDVKSRMIRTQPDGSSWAYSYSFILPLAEPIPLP